MLAMTSMTAGDFRDLAPDVLRDPHPLFERWRAQGPLVRVPELDGWVVTSAELAVSILRDPGTWSSEHVDGPAERAVAGWTAELVAEEPELAPLLEAPLETLLANDPPDHTRLRKVLVPWFSAAGIKRLEPLVDGLVAQLLPTLLTGRPVDFVAEYAVHLPLNAMSVLFGIAPGERRRFRALADAANLTDAHRETRESTRARLHAELELLRFFAARLEEPGDGLDPEGLVAGLAAAVDDGRLTRREAAGLCRELLVAGSDSTVNHLASALLLLARAPQLLARVREGGAALETFVEEALRLEPPFTGFWRTARHPVRLAGVPLPAGAMVKLCWPALNRDPAAHPRPDEVDLARPMPKRHLTFGQGVHFCIGAPLARLESLATFRALLPAVASIQLLVDPAHLRWRPSIQVHGLEALPVRLAPA